MNPLENNPTVINPPVLTLSQRLQLLPFELHYMIIDKYKQMFLFPEIRASRLRNIEMIKAKFLEFNITDLEPSEFADVNEYYIFSHLLQNRDNGNSWSFEYPAICIIGFQEYFHSLKYSDKQNIIDTVLCGNICSNPDYITQENYDERYELGHNIRDRFSNLLTEKFSHIIDPHELHSGASYGWCMVNLIPIIFGNNEYKITHWCKMIRSHF